MNTMYAAVARRSREIGTLRVLGFSQGSILLSFFLESVLLAALGGVLGCLLVLPLNGVTTRHGQLPTFARWPSTFRVTPQIMLAGIVFAWCWAPSAGCSRRATAREREILAALREV